MTTRTRKRRKEIRKTSDLVLRIFIHPFSSTARQRHLIRTRLMDMILCPMRRDIAHTGRSFHAGARRGGGGSGPIVGIRTDAIA